ncbi:hypothetical protein [Streptomyces cremeus]|uniref:hypothetical protein n=1 Tax=Streptomyces cremeus TaxID=66881 RepID=UPI0033863495
MGGEEAAVRVPDKVPGGGQSVERVAARASTVGHTETASRTPSAVSSCIIPAGSGHSLPSKRQSPWAGQWKKSQTMTDSGSPRSLYCRATERSSSWVR